MGQSFQQRHHHKARSMAQLRFQCQNCTSNMVKSRIKDSSIRWSYVGTLDDYQDQDERNRRQCNHLRNAAPSIFSKVAMAYLCHRQSPSWIFGTFKASGTLKTKPIQTGSKLTTPTPPYLFPFSQEIILFAWHLSWRIERCKSQSSNEDLLQDGAVYEHMHDRVKT